MPNNQAQDRYDPPAVTGDDWEEHKYEDLPDGSIFWLNTTRKPDNDAFRKLNDKQAMNTKNQIVLDVLSNINIFVKI